MFMGFFKFFSLRSIFQYTTITHLHCIFIICDLAGRERTKQFSTTIEISWSKIYFYNLTLLDYSSKQIHPPAEKCMSKLICDHNKSILPFLHETLLNVNLHLKRFHFTYWLLGLYIICRYFNSGHFWTFFFLWEYNLFWSHIYNWHINILCINVETVEFKKTILNYKLCRLWRGRRLLTEDLVWVKTIQAVNLNCYQKQKKMHA